MRHSLSLICVLMCLSAFGQAGGNLYVKSLKIINSDSTHGELDGTIYMNADGRLRYKENGTWYYFANTSMFGNQITNTAAANEMMKSDGTNAVSSGFFSTSSGNLSTTGNMGLSIGASSAVSISRNSSSGSTVGNILVLTNETSSTPGAGIGTGMEFRTETLGGVKSGALIQSVTTDTGSGTEDFDIIFALMKDGDPAVEKFRFASDGIGTAYNWVGTSDRRLKTNIRDVESQLDKVLAISEYVVNYDRIDNGDNETGFIAQDLYEVSPEYVVKGNDSTMWAVNYSKMVVPLYKAMAELSAKVDALEKENASLRNKRKKRCAH